MILETPPLRSLGFALISDGLARDGHRVVVAADVIDVLREDLRVALRERDEARAEVGRLGQALARIADQSSEARHDIPPGTPGAYNALLVIEGEARVELGEGM